MTKPTPHHLIRSLFSPLRLFLCGVACCLLAATTRANPADFDLPAQPAADALLAFSQQSGTDVLFSSDELRGKTSNAVRGRYEPEEALADLLKGTDFSARRKNKGKYVVTRTVPLNGSLSGHLLLPDGGPARGLRVSASSLRQSAVTDENGAFVFPALPPGTYRLVATGEDFRRLEIAGVRIFSAHETSLEPQMLQSADKLVQLDPFVVEAKSNSPTDNGTTPVMRVAAGNLDLPRTENDALPFQIYERERIVRSGVVNLNEFLQRELLDSDATTRPPEQNGQAASFVSGSTNLNLRGFGSDQTVILINGRRLPEVLTATSGVQPPDVNLIPLGLVQRVEVLPSSASALYSGNPVGGVINVVLRQNVNASEVTATYSNALDGFDAPQSTISLQHGESLLDGRLHILFNATFTRVEPPVESDLDYHHGKILAPNSPTDPIYAATPNVHSADLSPLFGPGTPAETSVAPGADGTGGIEAFQGREGVRNLDLFQAPASPSASLNTWGYPYGRREQRGTFFGSVVYDVLPWLQLGLDGFYSRTIANRGLDVLTADLNLAAGSSFNPFGQDVRVSLNETAPLLGADYSEARIESYSLVGGLLFKLPSNWRMNFDAQYARNITEYRGLAPPDSNRWQQLVDQGIYNPLRDTQAFGPPAAFYDRVLVFYGGKGDYVKLGDYQTLDTAFRVTNQFLNLPTGTAALNVGADYRIVSLADYDQQLRYADGSLAAAPDRWIGRTLQHYSFFGELQAPVFPMERLPSWLRSIDGDLALRYVAASSASESNFAPTLGLKIGLPGGFAFRGSFTTVNRFPTPQLSHNDSTGPGTGIELAQIFDPLRSETYNVPTVAVLAPDLRTEAAVTQTAGVIFQRGQDRHLRISLDFVDTHKTDELIGLTPQATVNLETVYPKRVQRAAPVPGDPNSVGLITSVLVGPVNAASRHSQDWNLSADYSMSKCLSGTLEVYGRMVYFQTYEVQLLPNSPPVDELNAPDGAVPGILRYRANFGAEWSGRRLAFGVDGHYYHERILPLAEQATQGSDHIDPFWQFDAYLQSDLTRWMPWKNSRYGLRGQLRINNIFGADFPRYANDPSGAGVQPYGDWRNRTYSLSLTATF
jgi:iron complex outermembrane recepter protein